MFVKSSLKSEKPVVMICSRACGLKLTGTHADIRDEFPGPEPLITVAVSEEPELLIGKSPKLLKKMEENIVI